MTDASRSTNGSSVVDREKEFWEGHEEFDWMAEQSKHRVVLTLPAPRRRPRALYRVGHADRLHPSDLHTLRRPGSFPAAARHTSPKITHVQLVNGDAEKVCFAGETFDPSSSSPGCTTCRTMKRPSACVPHLATGWRIRVS